MADFIRAHLYDLILASLVIMALVSTWISIAKNTSAIDESVRQAIEESKNQIKDSIEPEVVFCASIDQVRSEAARIISAAAEEFEIAVAQNAEARAKGESEPKDISQYFITIYGAASLGYQKDLDLALDNAVKQTCLEKYNRARQRASESKLRFRRYVSLLEPGELKNRSDRVQKQYIIWLKDQKSDLEKDANYSMILSPRAPRWGSSNTSIIGNEGIVEIKGQGGSAFAIYSKRIASDLRASLKADIGSALESNRIEISSARQDRMAKLTEVIEACEKAIAESHRPAPAALPRGAARSKSGS
jgi:hypothetical protein